MDSNSTQLCRVCLQNSDDLVNVFDEFEDATIASILVEHFWFQVKKNDGMTEWLCQICWTHIRTFHIFYNRIEFLHANYSLSADMITAERSPSPKQEILELDLNIVKCEVMCTETATTSVQISRENSTDESENSQISDDEEQTSNEKPKKDDIGDINVTGKQTSTAKIRPKRYNKHSQSELDTQNAQIREFFSMKCELCNDFDFETFLTAREHYREVHKIDGYLVCCEKKFHRRCTILNHTRRHLNPNAFACDECGKSFTRKGYLRDHIRSHRSRVHKCSQCTKSFTLASSLKYHVDSKHSKTGEIFICDTCDKKFQSKKSLKYHIKNVHATPCQHVCEICARQFKAKASLQNHIEFLHSTTPRPKLQCNICGVWLVDQRCLRNHMKNQHDQTQDDLVNCPICNKTVKHKRLLKDHIRCTHGERNHRCTMCDKAFRTATYLKEHITSHTGEYLYNCSFCEKKFKANANMYSHQKKAHFTEWKEKKKMEKK